MAQECGLDPDDTRVSDVQGKIGAVFNKIYGARPESG